MVGSTLLILDNIIANIAEGGGHMDLLQIVNSLAIALILMLSVISIYFSKLMGAKIKAIEVQKQTPLNPAFHTIIFTNYGNKTGVVIGPNLISEDERMEISKEGSKETLETSVYPIEPHGVLTIEVEIYSDSNKNSKYHLEFKDFRGKTIKLPVHTFYGSGPASKRTAS